MLLYHFFDPPCVETIGISRANVAYAYDGFFPTAAKQTGSSSGLAWLQPCRNETRQKTNSEFRYINPIQSGRVNQANSYRPTMYLSCAEDIGRSG
jgi:hypothetical protein